MGWHIFPCHSIERGQCTCGKGAACGSPGKHPRTANGVKDATRSIETIDLWWTTWPNSNIGLACGAASNVVVIDIDPRHSGFASLEEFETERQDALPQTLIALTGGGGRHLIFEYPNDGVPIGNRNGWLRGVDVKSDGGYVILTPGSHISGGTYSWLNWGTTPVPMPLDLLAAVRNTAGGSTRDELPDAATILEGIPEGSRDETLFRWACQLRRQLKDNRKAVEILVLEAARQAKPPFPDDEALRKVDQAFKQNHDDGSFEWGFITGGGDAIHAPTDLGNSKRFVDRYIDTVRYVPQWGWLRWTDIGWVRCGTEDINEMARSVPDIVKTEARSLANDNPTVSSVLVKWARASESAGHLASIEKLARDDSRIRRDVAEFDRDDHVIACRNGIVDLRNGELRDITRDDLVTKNTNVVYEKGYTLPEWEAFISTSTEGDIDLAEYLQRAAGYTLTGSNAEECFFIISGPPASGKSTYLDALHAATGQYGTTTQSDTFMYRRNQQTPKDELARLAGMRLVSLSEVREGEMFSEALIKQFTGGDKVTARFLYRDTFEFRPQLKLWIGTNHDPDARDDAMWRRIKKISFGRTIPVNERNPDLKSLLRDPDVGGKAVLAWAVQGAIDWYRMKLDEPLTVTAAVEDYRQGQDRFRQFLNETMLATGEETLVSVRDAYTTYNMWCDVTNEIKLRVPQFTSAMKARGIHTIRQESDGQRYFVGVKLKSMTPTENGMMWS